MTERNRHEGLVRLAVIPLRNTVLFPGVVQPIDVGRPRSLSAAERAASTPNERIAFVTQTVPELDDPGTMDVYPSGVEGEVLRVMKASPGRATVVARGLRRLELVELEEGEDALYGYFREVVETGERDVEAQGLALAVRDMAKQLVSVSPDIPDEAAAMLDQLREPGRLADVAASNLEASIPEKIELLKLHDVVARLQEVLTRLQRALETHRVKEQIDSHVRSEMGRHQREAMLRQRLRAIQEELGDSDEDDAAGEFEERIEEAAMPADVEEVARKQILRLRQIPPQSPEYTVTRTYLEWLVELPWNKLTEDYLNLDHARQVLDEDHYGLDKVKKRIVEYLAVRKLKPDKKGPILCLIGPPGVGKTSTGRSVARALGRKYVRASLGGVRDEAEIRGHRRTYVGALPGRIIQSMRRAGTRNPVFVLDEIDKIGADFRGDPAAALLEVLDPEQNATFSDHFLEVPFDLSQVLFFATANQIDPIPPALKDRLEILELPGYTRSEKLHIARRHLLPKQVTEHGLTDEQFRIDDAAVTEVIDSYTREAGVRNLERELASVCRSVAVKLAAGEPTTGEIHGGEVEGILGPQRFYPEIAERTELPGVATGLAWTPVGGELMFIEATDMPGKGRLILTGHLGEVMQESAQAALTFARSRATQLGLEPDFLASCDLHLHVPAGAVRKDGPSAGLTMVTALVSLLSDRPVRDDLAMTGEISLRGTIMPVGGIKEKVLAAHRGGIRRVLLPDRNRKDAVDIPAEVLTEMELVYVSTIQEAMEIALTAAQPNPRRRRSPMPAPVPDTSAHSAM
ncbi:MAG: endopeptidase La [Deltaproteobacteria bacterium]|nr:endopeptidase La [Deltaproteobacteria bacterium]